MSTGPDDLRQRYRNGWSDREVTVLGLALSLGALLTIGFATAVVGGLLWLLVWIIGGQSDPAVSSQVVGFEIVDDHTATIEARISYGDGPVEAECSLRAISHDKAVVGQTTYRPDPADGPLHEIEIRTERRATTVEWLGCRTDGQPRYR